jgi:hypothetical protein
MVVSIAALAAVVLHYTTSGVWLLVHDVLEPSHAATSVPSALGASG